MGAILATFIACSTNHPAVWGPTSVVKIRAAYLLLKCLFSLGVPNGNLGLSMSHFPRVDYLTRSGERGGSESTLAGDGGRAVRGIRFHSLVAFRKEAPWRWAACGGLGVPLTLKWRVGLRVESNFMHVSRFSPTGVGSSVFPRDLKTVTFPSLCLSQCFLFYCSEVIHFF